MRGADLRIYQGHRLVLLAPAAPHALAPLVVVASLGLAPSVATSLRASLSTGLRARLCASLSTSGLTVSNSRSAGSATGRASSSIRAGALAASSGNAGAVTRVCGSSGCGSVLGSGVLRGGGTRAGAVELTLDEGKGVLAILFAVALVSGLVTAVTAVWVSAVAVRLHLGAGLLGIVSMLFLHFC